MAGNSFQAQVQAFADKAKARSLAIFRESAQRVAEEAGRPEAQGGRMPVDTGFLMNSVVGSTSGMPTAASEPVPIALLQTAIGGSVWIGWTAAYARRMEYGFVGADSLGREYMQPGKAFLRGAVQNWQNIVNDVTTELQRRTR